METTMIEEYSKFAGELSECKSKEDRDSWLSGFGAFILGWQASEKRLLTPDAADLAKGAAKYERCPECGTFLKVVYDPNSPSR